MRPIHTLIWHCSATREGQNITVAEITRWHRALGWSDIGYHKVVYLDGSVHPGRPLYKAGAHVKGHNTGSLGYCYIGGVASDGKTPKDTRTPAQIITMERLTRDAILDYGITRVAGHNEFSAKACPSFYVPTDFSIQRSINDPVWKPHPAVEVKPHFPIEKAEVPAPKKRGFFSWFSRR